MVIFAATYTYDPERDDIHDVRPLHREYLKTLFDDGKLLASGPRGDGALLILSADSEQQAIDLLGGDPFMKSGIVLELDIKEWTVVYGPWA
ncbi:hypothetical protein EJ997_03900 [Flaviflexus ciconiae]|uniref:YCII-related domain-containing protein n=1 Tax=Flaviflexus ciconiae TaxID=2496867 RepID=A0A3S9Q0J1_9ACTO|nr:hypothetical protein EJ997_03900 [Flaviflexus ciconiae]